MADIKLFEKMELELLKSVQQGFDDSNVELITKNYSSLTAQDADKKMTLDHVFRKHLVTLLQNTKEDISMYESYIEMCIKCCRQDMCSATMPVVLLGDVFDALTLDRCELLFAFVENGVNIWKEPCFFSACKNNLLRMCNDLLRRLSRSQNTVFCGRILLFLAKFFPFSERSGLNVVSEFNLDNVTQYGADADKEFDERTLEEEGSNSDTKIKIDYNLYCKFWALQDFFRNPNQCYHKLQWRIFTSHAGDVLSAFSSFKLEDVPRHSARSKDPSGKQEDIDMEQEAGAALQQYFAKYLTNQKLLDLQLSDSNFRRYVLLQFLIIFQYLGSAVKFRPDTDELKPEQTDWVNDTTKLVYTLLEETPPSGKEFACAVRHILKREEHWNKWKNDGCPEFKKPVVSHPTETQSPIKSRPTKRLGDQMRDAYAQKKYVMGNAELTKLWNLSSNNLEACRSKERNFLPSLEGYFEEAIQQTCPVNADVKIKIEDNKKIVNDGNFGWRALRLLARRSPHFFTHSNNPINKLPEYLEMMIKRIAKDLPSTASSNAEDAGNKQPESMEEELQQNTQEDAEEDELLRDVKDEDCKDSESQGLENVDGDDEVTREKPAMLTQELIEAVATELGSEWTKLGTKLGYKADEIEYFGSEFNTDFERAKHLLTLWSQDDEDASVPGLAYTLTGLGLTPAADVLQ